MFMILLFYIYEFFNGGVHWLKWIFHDVTQIPLWSMTLLPHTNCMATVPQEKMCSEKGLGHEAPEMCSVTHDSEVCHAKVAPVFSKSKSTLFWLSILWTNQPFSTLSKYKATATSPTSCKLWFFAIFLSSSNQTMKRPCHANFATY